MDIEKIITQKQNEAIEKEQLRLKQIEEEKQKEAEKLKKGIYCTIKSSEVFVDIEEFINDFNKVSNVIFDIEEVSKNEVYFFKVKTEEEYSLIEEVFKSVLDKSTVNFIKNNHLKDIVLSDINNGYIEDIQKSKETILNYLEEDRKYSKERKESYNEYLDVKIQDLKNKFTAALISLYNIQEEKAINFVEIIYQQSNEYFEKYKNFGDMKPYTFQYNDKLNSKGLDNYSQTKNIDKLIEEFSENTSQYRRNETNFLTKLTNYAKKEAGIKSLKLRDLKVWQDAYYSGDKEVMDVKNQELFNTLKNLKYGLRRAKRSVA